MTPSTTRTAAISRLNSPGRQPCSPTSLDRPIRNSSASAAGDVAGAPRERALLPGGMAGAPAPRRFSGGMARSRKFRRLSDPGAVIAGWADGYRNTPIRRRGARGKAKALNRPLGPQISAFRLAEAASRLSRRGDPLVEPLASRRKERCRAIAADARLYPRRPEACGQAQ